MRWPQVIGTTDVNYQTPFDQSSGVPSHTRPKGGVTAIPSCLILTKEVPCRPDLTKLHGLSILTTMLCRLCGADWYLEQTCELNLVAVNHIYLN